MKWYVLTLFLVVGLVGSVSAQQIDSKLVWLASGRHIRSPAALVYSLFKNGGKVGFTQAGSAVEVVFSRGTQTVASTSSFPGWGGGISRSIGRGNGTKGYYTNPCRTTLNQIVSFDRK